MTEDIPKTLDAIPDQWIPVALVLIFCGFVIWLISKIALKQHDVIVKTVDHGQIIHDLAGSMQEVTRVTTATHSIVARQKRGHE